MISEVPFNADRYAFLSSARRPAVAELLLAARRLIDDPARWTQQASARDARGIGTADLLAACSFCILGAIGRACHSIHGTRSEWDLAAKDSYVDAMLVMAGAVIDTRGDNDEVLSFWTRIADFNDAPTTSHADVMAIFDRALALADCTIPTAGEPACPPTSPTCL